jgi:hypothetical protein
VHGFDMGEAAFLFCADPSAVVSNLCEFAAHVGESAAYLVQYSDSAQQTLEA